MRLTHVCMRAAALIVGLCSLDLGGFAATILKRNGEVIQGDIQDVIAIKSTTAPVTQDGKQYSAVSYVLINGGKILDVGALDVSISSGWYDLLTLSWEINSSSQPPTDLVALAQTATPIPSGFPVLFGFFDSGAAFAQFSLRASANSTVNSLFEAPSQMIVESNVPAVFAKPKVARILGAYTSANGGLLSDVRVSTAGGMVTLSPDDISDFGLSGAPAFTAAGVVSAASSAGGAVSPGEILSIYGSNLGPSEGVLNAGYDSTTGALPAALGEVSVSFDGVAAPLFFVRSDQINVQVPYEVADKASTTIAVTYRGAASAAITVPVTATRPGIFLYNGRTLIVDAFTGAVIDADHPINRGGWVTIYGTGPGVVNPAVATGKPAGTPLSWASGAEARISGQNAVIGFVGLAPGYAGLMQINVQVPLDAPTGADVPLELSVNGVAAQAYLGGAPTTALTIAVQ